MLFKVSVRNPVHMVANTNLNLHIEQNSNLWQLMCYLLVLSFKNKICMLGFDSTECYFTSVSLWLEDCQTVTAWAVNDLRRDAKQ